MSRLVSSLFAVAFVASFGACEQHSVTALPPHYQHKVHHGKEELPKDDPTGYYEKDPNRIHEEAAIPAVPAANAADKKVEKH